MKKGLGRWFALAAPVIVSAALGLIAGVGAPPVAADLGAGGATSVLHPSSISSCPIPDCHDGPKL